MWVYSGWDFKYLEVCNAHSFITVGSKKMEPSIHYIAMYWAYIGGNNEWEGLLVNENSSKSTGSNLFSEHAQHTRSG